MGDPQGDNGDQDQSQDSSQDEGGTILDDGGVDTDERAGRSQGIEPDQEPDEDTKQEMEEERERRLDPDNRPDGAEVDNTDRTFDAERGMFTDNEAYDESDYAPFDDPEAPENANGDAEDDTEDDDSDEDPS